jgi:SAM-dependent methyltransferase
VHTETDTCSICGNAAGNRAFTAREMMFGRRDSFEYLECACCGCVQLKTVPDDLSPYYPDNYLGTAAGYEPRSALVRFLRHQRARHWLYGGNPLGRLLASMIGLPQDIGFGVSDPYAWLRRCGVGFDSDILEVGCGAGSLLLMLRDDGFRNVEGVDLFVPESLCYENGVRVLKADIYGIQKQYDLIMLHHTFEHMPEPLAVLRQLHRLLRPSRFVVIRIPVASSCAYRTYGADWAQLDAPRHLFLHTVRSMELLAAASGFRISDVTHDSTAFQFWASEQYLADIPLRDERSYLTNPGASMFSPEQIAEFRRAAEDLNRRRDGDSACFYLEKKEEGNHRGAEGVLAEARRQ